MKQFKNITLFGLDCVDIDRLILAAEICQKDFEFSSVKLLTSIESSNPNVVKINPVVSHSEYSSFIIEKMADYIETDFALLIQHDGFILNSNAWDDAFLDYDYIGAPLWEEGRYIVGNGGFSLRSKKLLKIIKESKYKITNDYPEDWFISVVMRQDLESKGIRFAPIEIAQKFSFEANDNGGVEWGGQFGFHGLRWTDISLWLTKHPEYTIDNTLDSWALGVKEKFVKQ